MKISNTVNSEWFFWLSTLFVLIMVLFAYVMYNRQGPCFSYTVEVEVTYRPGLEVTKDTFLLRGTTDHPYEISPVRQSKHPPRIELVWEEDTGTSYLVHWPNCDRDPHIVAWYISCYKIIGSSRAFNFPDRMPEY